MFKIFKLIPKRIILLFVLDVIILFSLIVTVFMQVLDKNKTITEVPYGWVFLLIPITFVSILYVLRGYNLRKIKYSQTVIDVLLKTTIINTLLWGAILFLTPDLIFSRKVLLSFSVLAPLLMLFWRYIFIFSVGKKALKENILIVGVGDYVNEVVSMLKENEDIGYRVKSVIYFENNPDFGKIRTLKYKKGLIEKLSSEYSLKKIVLSVKGDIGHELVKDLVRANQGRLQITTMEDFYSSVTGRIPVNYLKEDVNFLSCLEPSNLFYKAWEFLFNLIFSLAVLILFSPFFLLIPILILVFDFGPIFYTQKRVGLNGKEFNFYKFRTMTPGKHRGMSTKPSDPRITKFGKILRASHLDEIPQLLNVLKRDMNIIGPRPEQPEFVGDFSKKIPFYLERHLVRPGVTGWAQVKQGYGFERTHEKLEYDLYYTKYRSITLDMVILLKTVEEVLFRKAR